MKETISFNKLIGSWVSEKRETEWGEAVFRYSFIKKNKESELLGIDDIKNINHLVEKIKNCHEKKYQYIKGHLTPNGVKSIDNFNASDPTAREEVVKSLNEVLLDYSFYKDNPFDYFHLNDYMEKFIFDKKNQESLIEVNRLLLNSIFPGEIIENYHKIKVDAFFELSQSKDEPITVLGPVIFISPYYVTPINDGGPYHIVLKNGLLKIESENLKNEPPTILQREK